MTTSVLDEIRNVRGAKKNGCQVLGCPNEVEVVVELRVREHTRERKTVASDSLAACPDHAVTVFKDMQERMANASNTAVVAKTRSPKPR